MYLCEYEICEQDQVFLFCTPGGYPEEVTWFIYDSLGNEVTNGVPSQPQVICVPTGTYKVVGEDSWGRRAALVALIRASTDEFVLGIRFGLGRRGP